VNFAFTGVNGKYANFAYLELYAIAHEIYFYEMKILETMCKISRNIVLLFSILTKEIIKIKIHNVNYSLDKKEIF